MLNEVEIQTANNIFHIKYGWILWNNFAYRNLSSPFGCCAKFDAISAHLILFSIQWMRECRKMTPNLTFAALKLRSPAQESIASSFNVPIGIKAHIYHLRESFCIEFFCFVLFDQIWMELNVSGNVNYVLFAQFVTKLTYWLVAGLDRRMCMLHFRCLTIIYAHKFNLEYTHFATLSTDIMKNGVG